MKEIPLTRGLVTMVDDCDFDRLSVYSWWAMKSHRKFYAARCDPEDHSRVIFLHRDILIGVPEFEVDHWNGDSLDNRRENLRPATRKQQMGNLSKRVGGTTPYKGVSERERGFQSRIMTRHLGYFEYAHEAALEYDREALKEWKEFAKPNFPRRGRDGRTTVLFVGWSGAGKDAASEYLASISGLRYGFSFSRAGLPFMAEVMGLPEEQAYAERHAHRDKWKSHLDYLRAGDETLLAEIALVQGEVLAGLRDKVELEAARKKDLFSHVVWVERPGVLEDSTVTFKASDCDCVIVNDGSLEDFHLSIWKWAEEHGLLKHLFKV